jgi:hypothetical protein
MDGGMKEPLAPALGALMVARVLFDVGDHSGIENTRAIRPGVLCARWAAARTGEAHRPAGFIRS